MQNLNVRNLAIATAISAGLTLSSLTGCSTITTLGEKHAIIFGENTATVIPIDEYYANQQDDGIYLKLSDGDRIYTSLDDTKIVISMEREEIESLIYDIMGEDVQISYYGEEESFSYNI